MTTGEKIQYYRKKLSLSQEELGQKLLVSRQTVSLWENGQTAPTIDNLVRLKEIFGVSVDELLGCETAATEESPEADPDTPVPSESYSVSFYKNELDKIYKYILKLSFKKPVISIIILAAMLAVYISLDIHDVLVGVFAGVLFIFVVSVLKQFLSHRKIWRESLKKVTSSRYEYRVYDDYFTVDIIRNNELMRSEKIRFTDIKNAHGSDDEKYVLLNVNNQLYILRKNDLVSNSAFYKALYNSSKQPDKKDAKKLIVAANVFFVLSLVAVLLLSAVRFEAFMLENPWLYALALPIPVICTILGFALKAKGFSYKKNVAVGLIVTVILCIAFSFNYFLSDIGYEYDPVAAFTEATRIALPEEIIDEYTVEFTDDTQPSDNGYIYSMSRVIFEEYSAEAFENSLSHDPRWLDEFPEEFDEILSPLEFDEGHETANKMMLYSYYSGEYNTIPYHEEPYNLMAVFYHSDMNMLEIFEYDCIGLDKQNDENTKEEIMKIKISEVVTWIEWDSEDEDDNIYEVVNWFEKSSYQFFSTEWLLEKFGYRNYQEIVDSGFFIPVSKTDTVAIMKQFVASHNEGEEIAKEIDNIIKNDNYGYDSGYAVAFRILMEVNEDILDEYVQFEKEHLTKDAVKWCEENGIEYYFENSEYRKIDINAIADYGIYYSDDEEANGTVLFDVKKFETFPLYEANENLGAGKVSELLSSGHFIELFRTDVTALQKVYVSAYKQGKYLAKIEKTMTKEDCPFSEAFEIVFGDGKLYTEWDSFMKERLVSDAIEWCNKHNIDFFISKDKPDHLGSEF